MDNREAGMRDTQSAGNKVVSFVQAHHVRLLAALLASAIISLLVVNHGAGLLLLAPALFGCVVVAAALPAFTAWISRWQSAFESLRVWAEPRPGKFARYFAAPAARTSLWIWKRTDTLVDQNLRAGVRLVAVLYVWAIMLALLAAAAYLILAIVVIVLGVMVVGWLLSTLGSGRDDESSFSARMPLGVARGKSGATFHQKTGMFSETEAGRVDADGNIYNKTGIFAEENVGRVDDDGRVYRRIGIFSEEETHRIADDGRVFMKTGIFSEEEVGRVGDDGRVFKKTGMFAEEEIGRIDDA